MTAQELRIGNLVSANGEVHCISKFDAKTVWFEKITNQHGVKCWITAKIDECEPILLMEEVLLKLGARKVCHIDGWIFYTLCRTKINPINIEIYEERTLFNNSTVNHCESLHQLQNLYFSIKGKELEINL